MGKSRSYIWLSAGLTTKVRVWWDRSSSCWDIYLNFHRPKLKIHRVVSEIWPWEFSLLHLKREVCLRIYPFIYYQLHVADEPKPSMIAHRTWAMHWNGQCLWASSHSSSSSSSSESVAPTGLTFSKWRKRKNLKKRLSEARVAKKSKSSDTVTAGSGSVDVDEEFEVCMPVAGGSQRSCGRPWWRGVATRTAWPSPYIVMSTRMRSTHNSRGNNAELRALLLNDAERRAIFEESKVNFASPNLNSAL